jgi:hypothetical protein
MSETRRRRIVRRTVLALAAVVLLPLWYVAAWLAVSKVTHEGLIKTSIAQSLRPLFVPILNYTDANLPGASLLHRAWYTTCPYDVDFSGGDYPGYRIHPSPASPLAPAEVEIYD